MKLEAITLREIQMPLVHFFETSFGRVYSRRILLLTAHCDGMDGWSECVAAEDPFYSSEWIETAWPVIQRYLAPAVMGRTLASAREVVAWMAKVRGHRMAKAAVENALWDAEARKLILARDHLGVKPLYYTTVANRLLFASEIKSLLEDPECPKQVDICALGHLFTLRYVQR